MRVLLVIEHYEGRCIGEVYAALGACLRLSKEVEALLVVSSEGSEVIDEVARMEGICKVRLVIDKDMTHLLSDRIAEIVSGIALEYDYVVASSTTFSKVLMPRVGGKLGIQPVSEVIEIVDSETYRRPIYAGNAIQTLRLDEGCKLMTIRASAFDKVLNDSNTADNVSIEKKHVGGEWGEGASVIDSLRRLVSFVSMSGSKGDRPELTSAEVVVSGGRGLKSAENFQLIYKLADKLSGAVGASRAAVDAGFVSNDLQIGQTGKIVAPKLYIAIGISGAIQHLAGMKDSKCIVAINSDEESSIFSVADYYMVGDLFEIVPELIEKL